MPDLPDGVPAPSDGSLPNADVSGGFAAYVHIPFCRVRCGYCDFNTYTNLSFGDGANASDFGSTLLREIDLSARVLLGGAHDFGVGGLDAGSSSQSVDDAAGSRPLLTSVFFGGGTPTMLPTEHLVSILAKLRDTFGVVEGGEVTTEANPETVSRESLGQLRDGGFTRMSFGMQSAVPHVLATLDRLHTPGQVERVVGWARELEIDHSVDLIYGTPGESIDDWRTSLEAAIALDPPHISAYGLTIEPGTRMGGQLKRGEIPEPDPDELAEKYMLAETLLSQAGYEWYEVSNWAKPGKESRHNLHYWQGSNWWGYGPGAHSHMNGTRFWNVKHPIAYAQRLNAGESPAAARELLTDAERREEAIMLGVRLREGIPVPDGTQPEIVAGLIADELVDPRQAMSGRLVLTVKGRLLADTVIRALW